MLYRKLGKTNIEISAFSFGTMRWLSEKSCFETVQRGIDAGMNYLDTSTGYVGGMSEVWTGRAVKRRRDEVLVSSKSRYGSAPNEASVRKAIENSLIRAELDYFDFYQLWGLSNRSTLEEALKKGGFLDGVHRAMADGLIKKGVGFTFHGTPDVFRAAVDCGEFLCATVSFNSMSRAEEKNIQYAADRGVGIFIMNPLGGGVLASNYSAALRFLLENNGITAALLGLSSLEQLERDMAVLADSGSLGTKGNTNGSATKSGQIETGETGFCTGCRYCEVCENGLSPSGLMQALRDARLGGVTDDGLRHWLQANYLNDLTPEEALENCIECGMCEGKCPQHLSIVGEIKRMKGLMQ
jgi:uncharacterized protein